MTLATYTDLQTSVASWLARSDLTAQIPDLIALCEADFLATKTSDDKILRVRQMEGRADATASTQYFAVPPDFLELRSLRIVSPDPGKRLDFATQDYIIGRWPNSTFFSRPRVFAIVGPEIMLGPAPDATYTLELDYYAFTKLSVAAPTNWLLTSYPAIYLYGTLMQSAPFTRADARMATWQGLYDRAVSGLIAADERARWGGKLVSRTDTATP